jgi:hypothetical protein
MSINMTVFGDTMPCSIVETDRRFWDEYCLHFQDNDGEYAVRCPRGCHFLRHFVGRIKCVPVQIITIIFIHFVTFISGSYELVPTILDTHRPDDGGSTYLWNVVDIQLRTRQYIPEDSELNIIQLVFLPYIFCLQPHNIFPFFSVEFRRIIQCLRRTTGQYDYWSWPVRPKRTRHLPRKSTYYVFIMGGIITEKRYCCLSADDEGVRA